MKSIPRLAWIFALLAAALACGGSTGVTPDPKTSGGTGQFLVLADRAQVFTITPAEGRQELPETEKATLSVGDGVDVDEAGRAILQFADLLTVEVLRDGEITIQEAAIDDNSGLVTLVQNGGVVLNDFNPAAEIDKRFTVQSEFAEITATGTRFLVVKEAGSSLEWVLALDAAPNDLTVTADGTTKDVPTAITRWIAPLGAPGPGLNADLPAIQTWLQNLQADAPVKPFGQIVWEHADVLATPQTLSALPAPGETFTLEGVEMTLTPGGGYTLTDCNQDSLPDIYITNGALNMDFRQLPNRVQALDVTILNDAENENAILLGFDPGYKEISSASTAAASATLNLRTDALYQYAELKLQAGCFLGFSLTPPLENGDPAPPRPAVETPPYDDNGMAQPWVVIDTPQDGATGLANGFTLSGRAAVPFERNLVLRIETEDGQEISAEGIFVEGGEMGGAPGTFSARVFADFQLPANIRVRVQDISMKDGSALAEDSILLTPLHPAPTNTVQRPPENGVLRAPYAPAYIGSIAVDGDLDDWLKLAGTADIPFTTFETQVYDAGCEVRYTHNAATPDLLGQAHFAYDEKMLFVVFLVTDDGYFPHNAIDDFIFRGDAPQLILDLDLGGDFSDTALSPDDIEIDIFPGFKDGDELFSARAAYWQLDTVTSREFSNILLATAVTPEGYLVEAGIPWEALGVSPGAGDTFGVAASISDNDTAETDEQQCMISTAPGRNFRDPTTWGTLYLLQAP